LLRPARHPQDVDAEEKEERPMRNALIAILVGAALLFALSVSDGWAGQIAGKIRTVDRSDRHFVLDDGTRAWVGESFPIETLKAGRRLSRSRSDCFSRGDMNSEEGIRRPRLDRLLLETSTARWCATRLRGAGLAALRDARDQGEPRPAQASVSEERHRSRTGMHSGT
jgi:hypothetical protein